MRLVVCLAGRFADFQVGQECPDLMPGGNARPGTCIKNFLFFQNNFILIGQVFSPGTARRAEIRINYLLVNFFQVTFLAQDFLRPLRGIAGGHRLSAFGAISIP